MTETYTTEYPENKVEITTRRTKAIRAARVVLAVVGLVGGGVGRCLSGPGNLENLTRPTECITLSAKMKKGHVKFVKRFYNPYRKLKYRCAECGRPAMHQMRRGKMAKEFCCRCSEQITGEACEGHELAGSISVMTVTDDQISEIWRKMSCTIHGLCTPRCLEEENAFGCCMLCGADSMSCIDRCTGWK
jgi:hypothetical protein